MGNVHPSSRNETRVDKERLAQDESSLREFSSFIDKLISCNIHELPDLAPHLQHNGTITEGLLESLPVVDDTMFTTPGYYKWMGVEQPPDSMKFTPQPLLRVGRDNSMQQVFFGATEMQWSHKDEPEARQIAVKPITSRGGGAFVNRILHEAAMYQYIDELGIPTLNVLAIIKLQQERDDVRGYMVTEFEPSLRTLDSVGWSRMSRGEIESQLDCIRDTMAVLHSNLVFHGDVEFKNIGSTSDGGLKIVDLDFATSVADVEGPMKLRKTTQGMSKDFSDVAVSMDKYIIPRLTEEGERISDIDRFNIMHDLIYQPYYERLVCSDSPHIETLSEAYAEVILQKTRQANGDW